MAPRLRRADCSGPGIRRAGAGAASRYVDDEGERIDEPEVLARIAELGDPARLEGRLDLPVPARPPAGDGHRRRRPQAVPLPRRLARAARQREVRRHGPLRRGAAAAAPRASTRTSATARRSTAPCVLAVRRAAARARLLPHRLGGVRGRERVLRARDDAQGARPHRAGRHDGLRLPGQERRSGGIQGVDRRAACARSSRALKRRRGGGAGAARLQGGPAAGTTCARRTSTPTSRRRPAATSPPRTSAPGTRPCWPRSRSRVSGEVAATKTGAQARGQRARSRRSRSYLGNTPAVCRASYIDPRVFDAYQAGLTIAPALERVARADASPASCRSTSPRSRRAVLDLLNEDADSAARSEQLAAA